ncbi:MAG: hypothetical protein EOP10_22125 [Proteobacteria bacterium]|nr:MAG: hypothetical protein EOP10_22125 [Pseudomonadota bacterium]
MMKTSNWSFSRKLLTVNLAYLLPCALLIFFLTKEKNSQIEFSAKEVYGLEYSKVLVRLFMQTTQHRIFSESQSPELTARAKTLETSIEREFKELDAVDQTYGDTLLFTDTELNNRGRGTASVKSLKTQWQDLLQKRDSRDEAYAKLFVNLQTAIAHATDTSNLILDPDLDSYYMMDVVTGSLPKMIEIERDLFEKMSPKTSDDEKAKTLSVIELATVTKNLNDLLIRIGGSVQTTLSEDKGFYGTLSRVQNEVPGQLKQFESAQNRLVRLARDMELKAIEGEVISRSDAHVLVTVDTLDSLQIFYDQMSQALEELIDVRMAQHAQERWQALVLTLFVWLIPALLSVWTVKRLGSSFGSAVARLLSQAESAHQSSSQLAQASSVVSSGSTEQAAALQETGASMSEMASMIARTTDQASNSQQLASRVAQKAQEGEGVMEKLVISMDSIQQANSQLQNISNIINEISAKTNMINDIVGKTQLLSFNASIEAARAGQHGRGFAVVAEEVGNLAQTSGKAAKGIRDLIDDSQKQVAHILQLTLDRVQDGKKVTEQAQTIFNGITSDIHLISDQVESVSEAAREQQFGIEQISKAMLQMDQTTRSNNSAAQTAAQLSDQLSGQSRKLSFIAQSISGLVFGHRSAQPLDSGNSPKEVPATQDHSESDSRALVDKITGTSSPVARIEPSQVTADDPSFKKVS